MHASQYARLPPPLPALKPAAAAQPKENRCIRIPNIKYLNDCTKNAKRRAMPLCALYSNTLASPASPLVLERRMRKMLWKLPALAAFLPRPWQFIQCMHVSRLTLPLRITYPSTSIACTVMSLHWKQSVFCSWNPVCTALPFRFPLTSGCLSRRRLMHLQWSSSQGFPPFPSHLRAFEHTRLPGP